MKVKFFSISIRLWFFLIIFTGIITQLLSAQTSYSGDNEEINVSPKKISRKRRSVTVTKNRIWEDGIVPYEIDANYSGTQKTLFKQAMRHWENYTCIKFIERDVKKHRHYITFTEKPCGCCSNTGKRGTGSQFISINDDCSEFGYIVHELGHTIGFYHEHTRPDRDAYVKILIENIKHGALHNFDPLDIKKIAPLTQPYDFDSIMHYASHTFSKSDAVNTIIPRNESGKDLSKLGQRIGLSEGDIIQANILYDCPKCGKTFQMSKNLFGSPIRGSLNKTLESEYCEWRISAAHGEKIIFTVRTLNIYKSDNCTSDYLEVIDGYSYQSPILGHICGRAKSMEPMVSKGNRMLIRYKKTSKESKYNGFTAKYMALCGGNVFINNTAMNYLESPNYPGGYSEGKECIWRVSVPRGHNITLKFQSFNLEYDKKNNLHDYLEIRDGHKDNSPLLGHYSGSAIPSNLHSSKNELFVKFVSVNNPKKLGNIGFSAIINMIN